MSKIDDGGPTFHGSLRDWFAGRPLTDNELWAIKLAYFAANPDKDRASLQTLRYFHADAMLAARKAGGSSSTPDLLAPLKTLRAIIHEYMTHAQQANVADELAKADAAIKLAEEGK